MTAVIGIDPGLDGALCCIRRDGMGVIDMPTLGTKKRTLDLAAIRGWIIECGQLELLVIEKVSTRPGLGAQSVLTTGYNAGLLEGIAHALERPYIIITPQQWTAHVGLPKGADKDMHRGLAQSLFPVYSHWFARKKDDGRADAALIAHYGATAHRREAA